MKKDGRLLDVVLYKGIPYGWNHLRTTKVHHCYEKHWYEQIWKVNHEQRGGTITPSGIRNKIYLDGQLKRDIIHETEQKEKKISPQ